MEIQFNSKQTASTVAYLIPETDNLPDLIENLDEACGEALRRASEIGRFKGQPAQLVEVLAPANSNLDRVILLGTGKLGDENADWEKFGATLSKQLSSSGANSVDIVGVANAEQAARIGLGASLGVYRYDNYRSELSDKEKPTLNSITIISDEVEACVEAWAPMQAVADGVAMARDLVTMPPNDLYPESYADLISGLSEFGLEVEILDEKAMADLQMNALLGVGQGSVRQSQTVIMKWMGANDASIDPIALVGKGVTFDTGGISLKPGGGMEDMKGDMGGSAAVVGTMLSLAKRKAKANVIGLVGLVENMPDAAAQRPGDIVKSASGKTIEIINTDAEGRLVLCDVLWYVQEHYKPTAIVDLATLTGAIIIALGHEHAGMFSNHDDLAAQLEAAGKSSGETVWRLPLGDGYDKQLKSRFADMKNVGGRSAGSITAAQFLQRFINKDIAWAHIDIAGTAWKPGKDNPLEPAWATGFGVRLLDRFIADFYEG